MKRTYKLIGLTVVLLGATASTGCHVHSRQPYRGERHAAYEYYYYPEEEVYFYPRTRDYYWNDRGRWRSGHRLPRRLRLRSAPVIISVPQPDPWRDHDRTRSRFSPRR